jgi:hypothetical protein
MSKIVVTLPGKGRLTFPEGTPDSVIDETILREFPKDGSDVARMIAEDPVQAKKISDEDFVLYEDYLDKKKTDYISTISQGVSGIADTVGKGVAGIFQLRNLDPRVAASTAIEGAAQGTRDLYGMVAQSTDPTSYMFKFTNWLNGTGTVQDRKAQWIEANEFTERSARIAQGEEAIVPGINPAFVNADVRNAIGLVADPSVLIPGLNVSAVGAKAVGAGLRVGGRAAQAVTRPLISVIDRAGEVASEALGTKLDSVRNVAAGTGLSGLALGVPGVSQAAAVIGGVEAASKLGRVAEQAGEQFAQAPTRIGPLESIGRAPNATSIDRALGRVGRFGGDDLIDIGTRSLAGAVEGAVIGGGLGYLSQGEEGFAAGVGSGGALGAGAAGVVRGVQKASGVAAKQARENDYQIFRDGLDEADQVKFDTIVKNSGINGAVQVMDTAGIIRGKFNDAEIRFLNSEEFTKEHGANARGVKIVNVEAQRPVVEINVDKIGSERTAFHELFHVFKAIDNLRPAAEKVEQTIVGNWIIDKNGDSVQTSPGFMDEAQILSRFDEYVSKLAENDPNRKINTVAEKAAFVGEELASEYMSKMIAGSSTDSMLRGFDDFTRTIVDRALLSNNEGFLRRTAQSLGLGSKPIESLLFNNLQEASPALNAQLRDMVRMRRNMDKKLELADEVQVTNIQKKDLVNPVAAQLAIEMNIAEKGADGVTRMKLDDVMSQEDKVSLDSLKSVIKSTPVADVNEPRMRELDGKISGVGISDAQLAAIQSSPNILDKVKKSFALIKSAIDNGEVLYIRNGKATKKITSRLTGKTLTRYNDGVRMTERDGVPYSLAENKAGELYLNLFDISKARRNAMDLASKDRLGPYQADFQAFYGDLVRYLNNLSDPVNRVPSKELFGDAEKAAYLTDFFGQKEGDGKASKFIRSLTLDRMVEMRPTGERVRMTESAYDLNKARFMPAENLGETKVFDAPGSGFRIIAKGNKHSLYAPTGERIGIYDTQAGAERKANQINFKNANSAEGSRFMPDVKSAGLAVLDNELALNLPKRPKVLDIANAFQSRFGKAIDYRKSNPQDNARLSNALVQEIERAVELHPEAKGWYDENIKLTMDVIRDLDPDLAKPENDFMFKVILAATSDGNKVGPQFQQTWKEYSNWKNTGDISGKFVSGDRIDNIKGNLMMFNEMVKSIGWEKTKDFFTRKGTVKEVRQALTDTFGWTKKEAQGIGSSELTDEVVPFAVVLGPKLGSFFNNLYGDFSSVTMDRWFMRTIGRLTGTQVEPLAGSKMREMRNNLRSAVERLAATQFGLLGIKRGDIRGSAIDATATTIAGRFAKKDLRTEAKRLSDEGQSALEETRKFANALKKGLNPLVEAPVDGTHRRWIRTRVAEVQKDLQSRGIELENADLQAVLWYLEKELYEKLNYRSKSGESDYASAASSLYQSVVGRPSAVYAAGTGRVRAIGGDGRGNVVDGADTSQTPGPEVTGQRFMPDAPDTPAFKKWFGESKVVDADGQPKIYYHGTNSEFNAFEKKKRKEGLYGKAFYFSEDPKEAAGYGKKVIPVYLQADQLFKGLPLSSEINYEKSIAYQRGKSVWVFEPTQIKLATGNAGTFDAANPDIRFMPDDATPKNGEPVANSVDAQKRFSAGERIFGANEQNGELIEITSLEMLDNFTADTLLAFPKSDSGAMSVEFSAPEKLPNGQAWSTGNNYRVIQKTGGKYRVYAPIGTMIGVTESLEQARRLIDKRK